MVASNEPGIFCNGDTPYYNSTDGSDYKILTASMSQNVVTGTRAIGTVYQNTTGKPMIVNVTAKSTSTSEIVALTDGSNPPTTSVGTLRVGETVQWYNISFVVLPNNYYKVTLGATVTLGSWTEWY